MNLHWLIAVPLCLLLALNLKASLVLSRAGCYEPRQKAIQFVLVWGVPVLGGALVWAIAAQSSATEVPTPRALSDGVGPCRNAEVVWHDSSAPGDGGSGGYDGFGGN